MDLESQHDSLLSGTSPASVCQDEANGSEINGRTYTNTTIGPCGWFRLDTFITSFANLFGHSQYNSILHSSQPSVVDRVLLSTKSYLFSSYINFLLSFVPIGFATYLTNSPPAWIFATNAMAIVPLSALLTDATEKIASEAGDTIGALLNISLGNLVELILFVAIREGHTRVVEASILGSILVNIQLILGSALLASSWVDLTPTYSTTGTQLLGCLLFVSVFAFLIPTAYGLAFRNTVDTDQKSVLEMTRSTACVVLAIYIAYIVHELRNAPQTTAESKEETPIIATGHSEPTSPIAPPPRTIRFAEEDIIDNAENQPVQTFNSFDSSSPRVNQDFAGDYFAESRGRPSATFIRFPSFISGGASRSRGHSRSVSLGSLQDRSSRELSVASRTRIPTARTIRSFDEPRSYLNEQDIPSGVSNKLVAVSVLILCSLLMSLNAEFLVSTIDEITHNSGGHLSETLIGLIILSIVGNLAEYITVVTVALRGQLDLAVAVSIGSSIQIALCVAPLTVIAAWIMNVDLSLTFDVFELASLVGAVLLVNIVVLSGGEVEVANALKGGLICGSYGIIAIGAFLAP